ncbi:hypothetical protein ACLKA6_008934 [Drosophila palustris]
MTSTTGEFQSSSCKRFIKMCSNTKTELKGAQRTVVWHELSWSNCLFMPLPVSPDFLRFLEEKRIKCAPIYLYTSLAAPTNRQK